MVTLRRWTETQNVGKNLFPTVSGYTRSIWSDEQQFLAVNRCGFAVNIGGGVAPLNCDVNVDPLFSKQLRALGENVPLQTGCCGTVALFSTLDHVIDDVGVLREARRILRKNGVLLVMQNVLGFREKVWLLRHHDRNHVRHYLFDWQLRRKLQRVGFKVESWTIKWYRHDRVVYAVCSR